MIRSNSSEADELVIGKPSEETKNHPRTGMQLVQYDNPLDIHHPCNLDKCRDENPLSMTTTEITTTNVHLLWENSMPQNSKRSRGAFARA
ncbi:unnamed protein product [Rhodiola kirilowii]